MRVISVREHSNAHGASYVKKKGTTYDAGDDAAALIEMGLVEAVKPANAAKR